MIPPRLEVADVFRQHEQEFLERWGPMLSSQQLRAFRDICACQTAALGARLEPWAELYSPAGDTFIVPANNIDNWIDVYMATLLPNGGVLFIGNEENDASQRTWNSTNLRQRRSHEPEMP